MIRSLVVRGQSALEKSALLKLCLKAALERLGLLSCVTRYASLAAVETSRALIAARFLRGAGLEIGAMHFPLPVPVGVRVRYVDRLSKLESMRRYPEVDASKMVEPDVVDDGFVLRQIEAASQDFVIANHVLEHSPNPILALTNWARVGRPGAILFVTVPIGSACFDRGRPETTVDHMLEDYRLVATGQLVEFAERNLAHYEEWVNISLQNVAFDDGRERRELGPNEVAREAGILAAANEDIHFHVYSPASFRHLLEAAAHEVSLPLRVEEVLVGAAELIGILRVI